MITFLVSVLALLISTSQVDAHTERWTATSKTAIAITGNIRITALASGHRIVFGNGASIVLKSVGRPNVYTIVPPGNPTLLHKNKLCGPPQPTFIVLVRKERQLLVKVFEGPDMPTGSDALLEPGMCASYHYER